MKIPTYQRQSQMPTKTGGGMLSSQASPSLMGLPGAAMSQLGDTIQNEGLRWLKTEVEQERATELAHNSNQFESVIQQTQENVHQQSVQSYVDEGYATATSRRQLIQSELLKSATRQSQSIGNSTVRRQFMSAARKRIAGVMPGISQTLRAKHADYGTMMLDDSYDNDVKQVARTPSDSKQRGALVADVFARIEKQAQLSGLKVSAVAKRKRKFLSDVDAANINSAVYHDNMTAASVKKVLVDIRKGKYPHLTAKKTSALQVKLQGLAGTLASAERNKAYTEGQRHDKELKKKRDTNYRAKYNQITDLLAKAAKGEDVDVSSLRATIATTNANEMEPQKRDQLLRRIDGTDEVRNPGLVNQFKNDIRDVFDDRDLEVIEQDVEKAYSHLLIGGKAYGELIDKIAATKEKTPAAKRTTVYRKRLSAALNPKPGIFSPGRGSDQNLPEQQALEFFDEQIRQGARPQEAYLLSVQEYSTNLKPSALVNELKQLSPTALRAFGFTNLRDVTTDKARKLNADSVRAAKEVWNTYARGELPDAVKNIDKDVGPQDQASTAQMRKLQFEGPRADRISQQERMTVRQLYEMENKIAFIEYIISKDEPSSGVKKPPPQAITPKEAKNRGGEDIGKDIVDWFERQFQ
jgi:hypothetical protein